MLINSIKLLFNSFTNIKGFYNDIESQ